MANAGAPLFPFGGIMKKLQPAPRTRESLPAPPAGMDWVQKPDTKEWRLVKKCTAAAAASAADAATASALSSEGPSSTAAAAAANKRTEEQKQNKKLPPTPVSPERPPPTASGSAASESQQQQLPPRASPQTAAVVVDRLPHLKINTSSNNNKEEDWEVLSDRLSTSSNHTGGVLVQRSGSVRSLNDANNDHSNSSTALSVPFKIQRTASSSTIDSTEYELPSGQGILGVDYVEHVVLPTDTLQGICLAYKVSSTRLRQANHFSGNSLLLAPKRLVVPLSKKALRSGYIRVQDTDQKEYKVAAFLAEFPDFGMTEAKAYLELADWGLADAVRSAREDNEWEREMDDDDSSLLRSGEIHITSSASGKIQAKGAGILPASGNNSSSNKPIKANAVPAIASKNVKAQDVYQAGVQHNTCGVELKSFTTKSD